MGLLDEVKLYMRVEGEVMKIVDKSGKIWYDENGKEVKVYMEFQDGELVIGRFEIDRYGYFYKSLKFDWCN